MSGQAVRNSALLSAAALASRLLGWVRLIVLVAAFGADGRLDPYLAAFKVPDIIYQLIAAGPLSSVLVPLVVRLRSEGDELRASHHELGLRHLWRPCARDRSRGASPCWWARRTSRARDQRGTA